MLNLYSVLVKDEVMYLNVEAEDESEAALLAQEWFAERRPYVMVEKMEIKNNEK